MIRYQMLNLFEMIRRAQEPEPTLSIGELGRLPGPGMLPMPWTFWLLVTLARHREKQLYVKELIRRRIRIRSLAKVRNHLKLVIGRLNLRGGSTITLPPRRIRQRPS